MAQLRCLVKNAVTILIAKDHNSFARFAQISFFSSQEKSLNLNIIRQTMGSRHFQFRLKRNQRHPKRYIFNIHKTQRNWFQPNLGLLLFELISQNEPWRFDSTRAHAGVGFVMMG